MVWNACSTFVAAFADVSKYGMFPLLCPANRQYFETVGGRLRTYLAPGKRALLGHHALVEVDLVAKNHKPVTLHVTPSPRHKGQFYKCDQQAPHGKLSGSRGPAWIRNSSRQLSKFSNVLTTLTSKTKTQQSAPR